MSKPVKKSAAAEAIEAMSKDASTETPAISGPAPTEEKSVADQIREGIAAAMAALPKQDMASLMKDILPTVIMAMESAKSLSGHEANLKMLKAKQALEEQCHICRQAVGDGKGRGCGGPWKRDPKTGDFLTKEDGKTRIEDPSQFHVQMVVFPSDPVAVQQWDGVKVNGAAYCSSGPNHKVWVPKQNDIAAQILKFEEDQRIQQVGRKHMRKSGSISGNGGQNVQEPTFT